MKNKIKTIAILLVILGSILPISTILFQNESIPASSEASEPHTSLFAPYYYSEGSRTPSSNSHSESIPLNLHSKKTDPTKPSGWASTVDGNYNEYLYEAAYRVDGFEVVDVYYFDILPEAYPDLTLDNLKIKFSIDANLYNPTGHVDIMIRNYATNSWTMLTSNIQTSSRIFLTWQYDWNQLLGFDLNKASSLYDYVNEDGQVAIMIYTWAQHWMQPVWWWYVRWPPAVAIKIDMATVEACYGSYVPIRIEDPEPNNYYHYGSSGIEVNYEVAKNVGINQMKYKIDSGDSISLPANNIIPMPDLGDHSLQLIGSQTKVSSVVPIHIIDDSIKPEVSILSPVVINDLYYECICETYTIKVTATDDVGVKEVKFYIDGKWAYTDYSMLYPDPSITSFTYQWDTTIYAEGPHEIKVIAYDYLGHASSEEITQATVDNHAEKIAAFFWASDFISMGVPPNNINFPWEDEMIAIFRNVLANGGYSKFFMHEDLRSGFEEKVNEIANYEGLKDTVFIHLAGHGGYGCGSHIALARNGAGTIYSDICRIYFDRFDTIRKGVLAQSCNSGGFVEDFRGGDYFVISSSDIYQLSHGPIFAWYYYSHLNFRSNGEEAFYLTCNDLFLFNDNPQMATHDSYVFFSG
ncbi:MAG: hypothetical protein JW891_03170 [Candidatus Lokiarchaeota archaeon]|nr:hypothetical protein [Candidatus Lokiarchaeota archaeon]